MPSPSSVGTSRRYYAWFCLLLVFFSGTVVGIVGVRFYVGRTVNRFMDSDENQVEDFVVDMMSHNMSLDDPSSAKLREILRTSFDVGKVAATRNRSDISVVIRDAFVRIRELLRPDQQTHWDMFEHRMQVGGVDPLIGSLYYSVGMDTAEVYQSELILARNYQSIRGESPLPIERLRTVLKEVVVKSLPEIRSIITPEKQSRLDALGPNLEQLQVLSRRALMKAFEWPGYPIP